MNIPLVTRLALVAIAVMALNILASILYMVVYGHLINPGQDNSHYQDHIQTAGPYCSLIAGIPLMFAAGWWVAGWHQGTVGTPGGMVVWSVYFLIDGLILLATGTLGTIFWLFVASFATKALAVWAGGRVRQNQSAPKS